MNKIFEVETNKKTTADGLLDVCPELYTALNEYGLFEKAAEVGIQSSGSPDGDPSGNDSDSDSEPIAKKTKSQAFIDSDSDSSGLV